MLATATRPRHEPAMQQILGDFGLPLIFLALAIGLLAATQIGRYIGTRQRVGGREDKDASTLASGMLGIFALLIAFTYSLSLARYDTRRQVVLEEANAIGTTANYALMLPGDDRGRVLAMLRDYTALRMTLGAPHDEAKFGRDIAASNAILTRLWQTTTALSNGAPQSLPTYRFVDSLNETTNIAEKRVTALRNHVPVIVLLVLSVTAMVSLGFAGYSAGLSGISRYIGLSIMAAMIAVLIALTIDLDRPNRGSIDISVQPLRDALAAIPER